MTVALISFSNQWLRHIACACVHFFKGVVLSPTSWMLGCILSMCVHPKHSRGPVPGSIQRRLGRTGDICWAQPGPNPRSIPRKAVAKVKDSPHSTLGTGNTQLDVQVWLSVEAEQEAVYPICPLFIFGVLWQLSNLQTTLKHVKAKKISQCEEFLQMQLSRSAVTCLQLKGFLKRTSDSYRQNILMIINIYTRGSNTAGD